MIRPLPRRVRANESVRGTSMAEAIVALLLGWLVVHLALSVLVRQRAVVARIAQTSDALATLRVARSLLGWETRSGSAERDGWALGAEFLGLRAYRGIAWICPEGPGGDRLLVRAEGIRMPDPTKDSVVVVGADGALWVAALVGDAPTSATCPTAPGEPLRLWRLSSDPPAGALARYFERGSYHLSMRALRWRRDGSGLQPMTPEALGAPAGRFAWSAAGGLDVFLHFEREERVRAVHLRFPTAHHAEEVLRDGA